MTPSRREDTPRIHTVLLVDDEPSVRLFVRRTLEQGGYSVVEAEDPLDALDIMDRSAGMIDLVLTDIVMPGMSGRMMADRFVTRYPGVRMLFMSGNPDLVRIARMADNNERTILSKPFSPTTLIERVEELLAA
jgi:CheY-like chemotaxis protein